MEEATSRHNQEADSRIASRHNDDVIINELKWIKEAIDLLRTSNTCEHNEVIAHQKITNGRVNKLEEELAFSKGAIRILSVLSVPLVISAMVYIINFFLSYK